MVDWLVGLIEAFGFAAAGFMLGVFFTAAIFVAIELKSLIAIIIRQQNAKMARGAKDDEWDKSDGSTVPETETKPQQGAPGQAVP